MNTSPIPPIEIFRAGTHTDASGREMIFSSRDVEEAARAYSPDLHEAPVVVGHPAHDDPAYGWVTGLRVENDVMLADVGQVHDEFAGMVRDGRFKKISASFYLPNSPRNPKPGVFYLRHVGFLGAQPPAVKGLKSPTFDEGDGAVCFCAECATQPKEQAMDPEVQKKLDEKKKEQEERQKELDAKAVEFAEREKKIIQQETDLRRTQVSAMVEKATTEGRLPPAQKDDMVAFMMSLDDKDTASFGEGKGSQLQFMQKFLDTLPKQIPLGVVAGADGQPQDAASFTEPPGCTVLAEDRARHAKIAAYAKANNIPFADAALRVGG